MPTAVTSPARGCTLAAQEGWSLMGPAPASPRRPGVDRLLSRSFQGGHCSSARLLPGGPRKPTLQPHLRELQSQDLLPLQVAEKRLPTLPTARSLRSSLPTVSHADCGRAPRAFATTPDRTTHRGL